MIDIRKISKKNTLRKNCIIVNLFVFIFLILLIIVNIISDKKIYISKNIEKNLSLKEQKSYILSKIVTITNFLKNKERLIINGEQGDVKDDNVSILKKCFITTPHIRNRIYRGKTDIIINNKDNFYVPKKMFLTNKDNGENNYISTLELNCSSYGKINSNKPFSINDSDIFISGDNFVFLENEKYLKITKNSHLKYKKNNEINVKKKIYDIKSVEMEGFFEKKYATFKKNVVFVNDDAVIKSQFAKVYFDDNQKPTDIFISNDVNINQSDKFAKSDFGYFDIEKNMLILYKNASLTSENNTSDGDFYIYNTDDKTIISFNENTFFYKKDEKNNVHEILKKLSNEVDKVENDFIMNVIENNNKNNLKRLTIKNSENYNIDRTKRTRTYVLTK